MKFPRFLWGIASKIMEYLKWSALALTFRAYDRRRKNEAKEAKKRVKLRKSSASY